MAQVTPDARFVHPTLATRWPHISLQEAKRLHELPGTLFVDGRARSEWQESHISGALSLPVGEFDKSYPVAKARLRKAKLIISYCHGENCRLSDTLAEYLVGKGHRKIAVFWGGFPAWRDAGYPLVDAAERPLKAKAKSVK